MNLEGIDCPQFIDFNTDSFLESFKGSSSPVTTGSLNQSSGKENYAAHVFFKKSSSFKSKPNAESSKKLKVLDINCFNNVKISQVHHKKNNILSNQGIYNAKASVCLEEKKLKAQKENCPLVEDKLGNAGKISKPHLSSNKGIFTSKTIQRIPRIQTSKLCSTGEISQQKNIVKFVDNEKQVLKNGESKKSNSDTDKNEAKGVKVKPIKNLRDNGAKTSSPYVFRARPLPKNIFIRPTGLGQKPVFKNTVAKSPVFLSEKRIQKRKLLREMKLENEKPSKKRKVECTNVQEISKKSKCKSSIAGHLNQVEQGNELKKKSKEKLQNKNKSLIFQDQFIPTFQSTLLSDSSNNLDQNEPFSLSFEESLLKDTNICAGSSSNFEEQPVLELCKKPFIPEKLKRRKTEFQEFNFHTLERANERTKLRKSTKIQEDHLKKELGQLQRYPLRKSNVIAHIDTIKKKPHPKRVTIAISPKFETEKRLRFNNRESKYYGLV